MKRVLAGDALPRVNALVDLYNMVSLDEVAVPRLRRPRQDVEGDLAFRFAREGDTFPRHGRAGKDADDPPKPGEVVYADARHVLCRRWNWRQDARTAVTGETSRVVLTAQSNGHGDVEAAGARLVEAVTRVCGGQARMLVADSARPVVEW